MDIYWEVPLVQYPEVCRLLWDCAQAEREGDRTTAEELKERIRLAPGYPMNYDPRYDIIIVVPKGASITVTPALPPPHKPH